MFSLKEKGHNNNGGMQFSWEITNNVKEIMPARIYNFENKCYPTANK